MQLDDAILRGMSTSALDAASEALVRQAEQTAAADPEGARRCLAMLGLICKELLRRVVGDERIEEAWGLVQAMHADA